MMIKKTAKRAQNMVHVASRSGEPMKSCYSYSELISVMEKSGFQFYEHLTPLQMKNVILKVDVMIIMLLKI